MAKYADALKSKASRAKLKKGRRYKENIMPLTDLVYRPPLSGAGSWAVEYDSNKRSPKTGAVLRILKKFALADDVLPANGISVLAYHQARSRAVVLARGYEGGDKPITVGGAVDAFEADLKVRGADRSNATSLRGHLSEAMRAKAVMMLTEIELKSWLHGLVDKGLKHTSANRYGKSFAAALSLAAKRDKRIINGSAWKEGLKPIKVKGGNNPPRDNYFLPNAAILAVIAECYVEGDDFGALIETLAHTGTRESQAMRLRPRDLCDEDPVAPRIMLWCSSKGRDRDPEQRAISITPKLAQTLRARAIARGPNRPLFDPQWNVSIKFRAALGRLGLNLELTPYVLRHSSIIRSIHANVPLRVIAHDHDTSAQMIEQVYARYIPKTSDDVTRKALLADAAVPATGNVVELVRGGSGS